MEHVSGLQLIPRQGVAKALPVFPKRLAPPSLP